MLFASMVVHEPHRPHLTIVVSPQQLACHPFIGLYGSGTQPLALRHWGHCHSSALAASPRHLCFKDTLAAGYIPQSVADLQEVDVGAYEEGSVITPKSVVLSWPGSIGPAKGRIC
jgi:hypothetical protein